jgi:hypothetical protein
MLQQYDKITTSHLHHHHRRQRSAAMADLPNTAQVLHEAILTNSLDVVQSYLGAAGVDPNQSPPLCPLAQLKRALRRPDAVAHDVVVVATQDVYRVSPLHVAIFNCYHNHGSQEDPTPRETALAIVQALVDAGADTTLVASHIAVVQKRDSSLIRIQDRAPIGLALLLKQNARGPDEVNMVESLDAAMQCIVPRADARDASGQDDVIETMTVPESFAQSFGSLLFSQEFSDVKFVCKDGTVLHAHQNILAAASSYFRTYFQGPWGTLHTDGCWKTEITPDVLRAVLMFVYTGKVDDDLLEEEAKNIISVAHEYELFDLQLLAQSSCVANLCPENSKEMLQLAKLHESDTLKDACFDYIKENMAAVLMHPTFVSLADEDSALWAELNEFLQESPTQAGRKRSRS